MSRIDIVLPWPATSTVDPIVRPLTCKICAADVMGVSWCVFPSAVAMIQIDSANLSEYIPKVKPGKLLHQARANVWEILLCLYYFAWIEWRGFEEMRHDGCLKSICRSLLYLLIMIAPKVGEPKAEPGIFGPTSWSHTKQTADLQLWKNQISLGHPDYHIVLKELGAWGCRGWMWVHTAFTAHTLKALWHINRRSDGHIRS